MKTFTRIMMFLLFSMMTLNVTAQEKMPGYSLIPAGKFEMGDHLGFVDPKHGGDETPIHTVQLDSFYMGIYDVTTQQYCDFLNSASTSKTIEVRKGGVYMIGSTELLFETREMSQYSRIGWDGKQFSVLDKKDNHPIVCIRWAGAALYCNWLSCQKKLQLCYNTTTWECNLNKNGYRLPTEAEWEYAARGGLQTPYRNFPWGDDADATKANWPESKNPFRAGAEPWTTPVGFFNGKLQNKADFNWPGNQESYQTSDGANGYGLYDMSGNVWQFINDWYSRDYYGYSAAENPGGPVVGSIMPDGKAYRGMRGGNWYNGENGHGRVSNRNPSYFRGPLDPNHPYYHLGFRVVLPVNTNNSPVTTTKPKTEVQPKDNNGGNPPTVADPPPAINDRTKPAPGGVRLLPPQAEEKLNLTTDQKKQIADLENEVKAKLNKILTTAQLQQIEDMRPARQQNNNGGGGNQQPTGNSDNRPPRPEDNNGNNNQKPASTDNNRPPRPDEQGQNDNNNDKVIENKIGFILTSSEVKNGGTLPVDYTSDGTSATLPLAWSGAPEGTKSYALIMHHIDPQGIAKWYWILYNIPANTKSLPKNVKGIGILGNNSVNERAEYAPPKSKGPGAKKYIYTIYALSATPEINVQPSKVNRELLLATMKDKIIGSAELSVVYSRIGEDIKTGTNPGGNQIDNRPPRPDEQGNGQTDNRPPRPGEQDNGQNNNRPQNTGNQTGQNGPGNQGGGGKMTMAENKLPASPTPGQTVGLYLNTPKSFTGYTLMAPKHNIVTYLLDNTGHIVNQWKSAYEPGQSAYILPNGHLLRAAMLKIQGGIGGGEGGRIEEFDWEGKMVWEFDYATPNYQLHHDIKPLPNGHVLALMVERKTSAEAIAAGFDIRNLRDGYLVPDAVVEIEPIYPKGGKIVWEWHVWDHLIQDFDRTKTNYGDVAEHPELIDTDCSGRAVPAFWNHMNSIAYNAKLDQIMLSVRGCNEIWIIDHSTTSKEAAGHTGGKQGRGGDLIYRWGNPAAYQRGTEKDKQLIQQHDAEWIPDGYPGAGNITIFNNGYDRGWSSIEEIVPPIDATGKYLLETGKTYGPAKPVWHYEAKNRTDFFSAEISGASRLPNGNTLICAGVIGNLFEITPAGETVWQYINPMVRGGILAQGENPGKDMRGHLWNAVFKVHRYEQEYSGLAGRDLTPKGVVELPASQKGKTGMDNFVEQPNNPGGNGRPPRNDQR